MSTVYCSQRVGLCAGRNGCSTARPGRNFLAHGQNTTAWSELQLLNIPILSPGWRKAHVGCSNCFSMPRMSRLNIRPALLEDIEKNSQG